MVGLARAGGLDPLGSLLLPLRGLAGPHHVQLLLDSHHHPNPKPHLHENAAMALQGHQGGSRKRQEKPGPCTSAAGKWLAAELLRGGASPGRNQALCKEMWLWRPKGTRRRGQGVERVPGARARARLQLSIPLWRALRAPAGAGQHGRSQGRPWGRRSPGATPGWGGGGGMLLPTHTQNPT